MLLWQEPHRTSHYMFIYVVRYTMNACQLCSVTTIGAHILSNNKGPNLNTWHFYSLTWLATPWHGVLWREATINTIRFRVRGFWGVDLVLGVWSWELHQILLFIRWGGEREVATRSSKNTQWGGLSLYDQHLLMKLDQNWIKQTITIIMVLPELKTTETTLPRHHQQ